MPDNAARTMRERRAGIVRAMLLYVVKAITGSRIQRGKESLLNGPDLAGKT